MTALPIRRLAALAIALGLLALSSTHQGTSAAFTDTTTAAASLATGPFDDCYASKVKATSNLVNYWRLGESSGTTAADSFGSNNGTYSGSPTMGVAAPDSRMGTNTAITVSGSNGARFGNINGFAGTAAFSIEMWVYRTHTESYTRLLSKDDASENGYFIDSKSGELLFTRKGSGTNYISGPALASNTWTHLVVTYDGTNGRIYFNGVLRRTTASSATIPSHSQPFTVGNSSDMSSSGFKGRIDEVAVYNTALSGSTISDHYSGTC